MNPVSVCLQVFAMTDPEPAEAVLLMIIVTIAVSHPTILKSVYVLNLLLHVRRFPCAESADRDWETRQERNSSSELRSLGEAPSDGSQPGSCSNAPQGEETPLPLPRMRDCVGSR